MRIVNAVMDGDWKSYVASQSPQHWRETLATLLSSAPQDQFCDLANELSSTLLDSGAKHASLICSICVGNVELAVTLWNEALGPSAGPQAREALLEKAVILGIGVDKGGSSSALGDLLAKQAEELASAGQLSAVYDLLSLVPGGASEKANDLRDRLYQGGALDQPAAYAPPEQQQQEPPQQQFSSQSWDASFQQPPQHPSSYTHETYSAAPSAPPMQQGGQESFLSSAPVPSAPPTTYGNAQAPSPYNAMDPTSPYSTMSTSQAPPGPSMLMPAQPDLRAPPTAFQPAGSFGVTSPRSPQSSYSQAPPQVQQQQQPPHVSHPEMQAPQVFQSFAQPQPQQPAPSAPLAPPTGFSAPAAQQETIQEDAYAPAPPPQVFQPMQSSEGFQQPQKSFSSTFQPGVPSVPQAAAAPAATAATAAPAPPPKPAGPPSSIALMTADISKIPGNLVPIVNSFRSLYQAGE